MLIAFELTVHQKCFASPSAEKLMLVLKKDFNVSCCSTFLELTALKYSGCSPNINVIPEKLSCHS